MIVADLVVENKPNVFLFYTFVEEHVGGSTRVSLLLSASEASCFNLLLEVPIADLGVIELHPVFSLIPVSIDSFTHSVRVDVGPVMTRSCRAEMHVYTD